MYNCKHHLPPTDVVTIRHSTFKTGVHVTLQLLSCRCALVSSAHYIIINLCQRYLVAYAVAPLPATDSHYLGPPLSSANSCLCSTVAYSLMSACGICQGSDIIKYVLPPCVSSLFDTKMYLSWSTWSANCATVSIST